MAMQLGSAGNMFDTPNPSRELQLWQENNRQNQELQMRQQQLQANLASQQLQDQTTQLQNARLSTGNQFDLDTYQTRIQGLTEQLTGQKIGNALSAEELRYRPDLWRSQLKSNEAQTDLTKTHVAALRDSMKMDKDRFELAKRAADQEFAANEINNNFKMLQMPGLMTEMSQKIAMNAATLRSQTLQNMLADKQVQGFDMSQALDRFRAYQQMDPELRKTAKKYAPELYGDLPDYLEEDDLKTINTAVNVLRIKQDPAMQLMGKVDPAMTQLDTTARQMLTNVLQRAQKRGKTDKSVDLETAMTKLSAMSRKNIKKDGGEAATTQPLDDNADTIDRLQYHFSQHKAESNRQYRDVAGKGYVVDGGESDFVSKSPLGNEISSGQGSKWQSVQNNPRSLHYVNPSLPKDVKKDFEYAVSGYAASEGTNKQVTAFRSLVDEVGDSLASGNKEAGKDIIEKYGRLGEDFFTPKQKKVLQALLYKFGWSE